MATDISNTNFTDIRQSIIDYFKTKPDFTDYNFNGSAASIFLDILAYNAFYKNVYSNMTFNETFLDTANIRQSVVSRAKELGYLPRSRKAAKASVRLSFTVSGNPAQYTMPKNTRFSSSIDGVTYTFVTPEEYVFTNSANTFTKEIEIVQGVLTTFLYTIDTSNLSQRVIVPSPNVDLDYLSVVKKDSVSSDDSTYETVQFANDLELFDIDATTSLYFMTETYDGFYRLSFGDGVLGAEIDNGNVIRLDYLITDGDAVNGATSFSLASTLSGVSSVSITTVDYASGGAERETIDSIKYNAPLFFEAHDRAVTENDYRSIVLSKYGNIDDVIVWGGEKNNPPFYGRVYVAIKPLSDTILTNTQKESISNDILSRYNIVGIIPEIADPNYLTVSLDVTVTYNSNLVSLSGTSQLQTAINTAINTFFSQNANKFGQPLYYSKLVAAIDSSSPYIKQSITNITLERSDTIVTGIATQYKFEFNNAIQPNSIISNQIEIDGYDWYVKDVPTGTSPYTAGTLAVYRTSGASTIYYSTDVGTVDYNTGEVIFSNFRIDDIPDDPVEKLFTISVAQGNFVDPNNLQKIVTDYNVYTNERDDVIVLKDSGISITLVSDKT